MKPVLIFRHSPSEGSGYFAEFLQHRNIAYKSIAVDAGEPLPDSPRDASGLVFMGGPMSVNDPLPWIPQELYLIRQAIDLGVPVLGHCLGGQLISKALGGRIVANPVKEIGWHAVEKISSLDWLQRLPTAFEVFHWHGETFTIPLHAQPILTSNYCANQGFTLPKILALQCHIEMTVSMVKTWVEEGVDELADSSPSVQTANEILSNLSERVENLQKNADVFYTKWIEDLKR